MRTDVLCIIPKIMIPLCTVLALIAVTTLEQVSGSTPISPCPSVFMYDLPGSVPGQWSGVIKLSTDTTLYSLWLNIVLDNKANNILGKWVRNVSTVDNKNFKIESADIQINPGPAMPMSFVVRYNPFNKTPRLKTITFNGREICNSKPPQPYVNRPNTEELGRWLAQRPETQRPRGSEQALKIDFGDAPDQTMLRSDKPSVRQAHCGEVVLNAVPLVVNGTPTWEGQWPWHIALYKTDQKTIDVISIYLCGGTLVTYKHVITAAHCIPRKPSQKVIDHNTLVVYLGKHNLRTPDDRMQIRLVGKVTIHPDYNPNRLQRDVAILELREEVSYSYWVRPACLWPDIEIDLTNVIGKIGSVVGWGFDETGEPTEELKLVEMPVVSQETCISSHSEFFLRFTSEYTYCAGYRDGSSPCKGDSGGGMVFKMGGIWYLRGLVSLSMLSQAEKICDPSHYIIFTDLAKYLPWIYDNISD